MNIRVLIVDDEPLSRRGVAVRLESHDDLEVVGECEDGESALKAICELKPDLVFLDIQMPGLSGIDLLKTLPERNVPAIIFLTAHDNYAVAAFEVQALDYLLKPIDDDRFLAALHRARKLLALEQQQELYGKLQELAQFHQSRLEKDHVARFAIRTGRRIAFVEAATIDWIEAVGDYAGLHVGDKTHLLRESLNALETQLDSRRFLRIHRSSIVQVDRIKQMDPLPAGDCHLLLHNGTSLRASRSYSKKLRQILRNHG